MDPLVFLVGGVALLTYALHGFNGMLSRDLAVYSYAGQQVAEGVPPYLGILNRAGPLAHVIPGIGVGIARIGGFDDVLTMRLFFMVIATLCVCAVYVLGRDVFASRLAGLVTAAAFLTFFGFIEYASNGPREKTPMTLFITLALWSVAKRRWFTAGLFVSLATLCLQIAFFSSFAAVLAGVLFLAHGERLKALLRVAVGGAVPVAVLGVWFAIAGSLRESVDAFVLINFRYTTPDPVLPVLDEAWLDVTTAYGVSLWVLFAGLVALPLLSLGVLRKATRLANPWLPVVAAFTVGAAVGLAWNFKEYDAWPDLFPMLPFAAVGLGGVFHVATKRLPVRATLVAAVALSLVATVLAIHHSVTSRGDRLETQRASVKAVSRSCPTMPRSPRSRRPRRSSWTSAGTRPGTRCSAAGLQFYIDDIWPGGLDGFRRDLVEDEPDMIVFGDPVSDRWRAAIEPEYVYVGKRTRLVLVRAAVAGRGEACRAAQGRRVRPRRRVGAATPARAPPER